MTELEKLDILRQRLGLTYKEAKEALDAAGGDLIQALINMESKNCPMGDKMQKEGVKLLARIKEIIQQGNVTRVRIKKGEETVMEIPATVGAIGLLGVLASTPLTLIAGIGTVAAMVNNYRLEIEKKDGEIIEEEFDR